MLYIVALKSDTTNLWLQNKYLKELISILAVLNSKIDSLFPIMVKNTLH